MAFEEKFKKEAKKRLEKRFRDSTIDVGKNRTVNVRMNLSKLLNRLNVESAYYITLNGFLNLARLIYVEENLESEYEKVEDEFYNAMSKLRNKLDV